MQIPEQEAEGVAQLAVDLFGQPLQQRNARDNVFAIIHRRDPQPNDLRAELARNLGRRNIGPARLRKRRPCSSSVQPGVRVMR